MAAGEPSILAENAKPDCQFILVQYIFKNLNFVLCLVRFLVLSFTFLVLRSMLSGCWTRQHGQPDAKGTAHYSIELNLVMCCIDHTIDHLQQGHLSSIFASSRDLLQFPAWRPPAALLCDICLALIAIRNLLQKKGDESVENGLKMSNSIMFQVEADQFFRPDKCISVAKKISAPHRAPG